MRASTRCSRCARGGRMQYAPTDVFVVFRYGVGCRSSVLLALCSLFAQRAPGSLFSATMLSNAELTLLDAWAIGPVISAWAPGAGTINRTVLIDSASGRWVLRAYRHRDRTIVEREHAVIVYACACGLPAVAPLPLAGGATIAEQDGRFYALFPHARGRQVGQAGLGAGEIAAMGRCLAVLHHGLRGYPAERVTRRSFAVDRAAALARVARLEQAIHALPQRHETDRQVLAALAGRRDWIERAAPAPPADPRALAQQPIP